MSDVILETRDLTKHYGGVHALEGANFILRKGEHVAIMGDNGAGKSTFVRQITGVEQPSRGEIHFFGQQVAFKGPIDAREAGIETVFQTLALADDLDVPDNLFLGREMIKLNLGPFSILDYKGMREATLRGLQKTAVKIPNLRNTIRNMSGGQRQCVAIARTATFHSKLTIMDEPTAALGVQETAQVEKIIRTLKEQGEPLILISHNMRQVFDLVDRIVVFRRGRICADLNKDGDRRPGRRRLHHRGEDPAPLRGRRMSAAGSRHAGTRAIVTGGAQGLGFAVAQRLVAEGCTRLVLGGRDAAKGAAAVRALGVEARFVAGDLARVEDCFALVDAAEAMGGANALVNAAAACDRGGLLDTTPETWARLMDTNARGPFFTMQRFAQAALARGEPASVVNILSMVIHCGQSFLAPYTASKAALAALTKNLAQAHRRDRIRFNGIACGWMDTEGEDATQRQATTARATTGWRRPRRRSRSGSSSSRSRSRGSSPTCWPARPG